MEIINFLEETGTIHIIAGSLGLAAILFGFKAKRALGGKLAPKFFNYFFFGILFLGLIHVLELGVETWHLVTLSDEIMEMTEHVLFYLGMLSIIIAFWRIIVTVEERE